MFLTVRRHTAVRTGKRLFERVMLRCDQCWPFKELLAPVVPEPVLAGLEASDHRVAGDPRMVGGVLARGVVATADMTARGAAPQMEPPAVTSEALDAPCAAGRCHRDDSCIGHQSLLWSNIQRVDRVYCSSANKGMAAPFSTAEETQIQSSQVRVHFPHEQFSGRFGGLDPMSPRARESDGIAGRQPPRSL